MLTFIAKLPFRISRISLVILTVLAMQLYASASAEAQCVRIRDRRRNNAWTFSPRKDFRCLAAGQSPVTTFTITFESAVSNVTINWGDTTVFLNGPVTTASRTYRQAGIFNYVITQSGCDQQIRGIFVNDYNTTCPGVGWIAPPNNLARCLPDSITISNFSPGMNGFTEWIINWGDLSRDTADYPSFGNSYSHKYKAGSKICNAIVSISYRNSCNIVPCGQALFSTFGPYKFMERDSALVDRNSILICGPTDIDIRDVSVLNCRDTANRQISWTALDGFSQPIPNPGNNIWRPRGPLKNQKITIPADMFSVVPPDSIFRIRMRLRNKCGEDTAETVIKMVSPVNPVFSIPDANPCVGTVVQFNNLSPNPNGNVQFVWDYGDGKRDTLNTPTATHVYTVSGALTVTLKARTFGYGTQVCERTFSLPVEIKPAVLPDMHIFPSRSGCDSLTAVVKNKSLFPGNTTWNGWMFNTDPAITGGTEYYPGPASSDPSRVAVLATNPADSSATLQFRSYGRYILSLKGTTGGCGQNTGLDTVKVYPSPRLRWSISSTNLCQGETFFIRDSSRVMQTDARGLESSYNHIRWRLRLGSDTTISPSQTLITGFDSPSASNRLRALRFRTPGVHWVKLTVWTPAGCEVSDSVQVTVRPSAIPVFRFLRQPCDNSNIILRNQTIGNANQYYFKIYKNNGILQGQEFAVYPRTNKDDQLVFLPYAPPGDSTFYYVVLTTVTVTNGDTCVLTSSPQLIKVAPTPVPGLNVNPPDGCSPLQNVTVVNTSVNLPQNGQTSFEWRLGSLGTFNGATPPPLAFSNPGNSNNRDTIRVCVLTGGGCRYCAEKVVITYPQPKAQIIMPDSVCSGEAVSLSASTIGAVSSLWSFADYDGSSSAQNSPVKTFHNLDPTPRYFTVKLTVRSSADCPRTVEKVLKVNPNPSFSYLTQTVQDANCGPLRARFSYQNVINSRQFRWSFGDGDTLLTTSLDTVRKTYSNETSSPLQQPVQVTATSASGCKTTRQTFVTVNPLVRARFRLNIDSGCTPLRVTMTDSSTVAANVRRWIVNGTQLPGQTSQYTYTFQNLNLQDTTYRIRLAVRNDIGFNCVDTATRFVRVFPKPRANDLIITPPEGCSPHRVYFKGNVENAVLFDWTFGDGTDTSMSSQEFHRTFYNGHPVASQVYSVTRFSRSIKGCMDTTRRSVVVHPNTRAIISGLNLSGCTPFTVQFSGLNSVNANAFQWNFGDGSPVNTSSNPNYTYVNNSDTVQVYRVRLIARKLQSNACPDTAWANVTVYPSPKADFGTNTNIGCGPLPVRLTNTSLGGQYSYWVMNSGGISDTLFPNNAGIRDTVIENPNFAAKTLQVTQTVVSVQGCTDRKTQTIQIYPNLTASFVMDTSGCHPHLVRFLNTSENFLGTFIWNFGNGSISNEKNPSFLYENFTGRDTTFRVALTSVSPVGNCIRRDTQTVRVYARPVASFRFASDSSIQLPQNTVTIENRTAYRNQWSYAWTFDDGTKDNSSAASFVHTFPLGTEDFSDTTFTITQIATSPRGCSDTLKKVMVIKPGHPVAEFEATPREGCRPLEVQFTSLSSYARRYEWSYVDKEGSPPIILTERNPAVYFETEGLKTVKLKIRGIGGQDSIEKVEYIRVFPTPRSSFTVDPVRPQTVVVPEEPAYFTPNDNRPDFSYFWTFGDGGSSDQRTATHRYQNPGIYDVSLRVTGPYGCSSTDTLKGAIEARGDQVITIPTAFTPNPHGSNGGVVGGDGVNDVFYPYVEGLTGITMQIFNRWGMLIYQGTQLNRGWDGYYRGKLMPADSYVYRIMANFSNGESRTFVGDVSLIR